MPSCSIKKTLNEPKQWAMSPNNSKKKYCFLAISGPSDSYKNYPDNNTSIKKAF